MPLVPVKDILKCADENQFAAAAFDVFNFESISWVVKAAEIEKVPVILMFYPDMKTFIPLSTLAAIANDVARNAAVPVGVHLDHSRTFHDVMLGIPAGFQSIMFDGSARPFEENAAITRQVVESAHIMGVDVEAELGLVGSGSRKEDFMDDSLYTDPAFAKKFAEETNVDSLAVAIGNSHGHYVCEPHLDIKRLDEINRTISTPLVLHGGSGIPPEQVTESVKYGINKVNIGTEFFAKTKAAGAQALAEENSWLGAMNKAGEEVIPFVRSRLQWLNPTEFRLP